MDVLLNISIFGIYNLIIQAINIKYTVVSINLSNDWILYLRRSNCPIYLNKSIPDDDNLGCKCAVVCFEIFPFFLLCDKFSLVAGTGAYG